MTRTEAGAIVYRHMGDDASIAAVDAIIEAVAIQRAKDAAICRRMHTESQQRFEMAMVCAREIERDTT